jgi:hypothetical protein
MMRVAIMQPYFLPYIGYFQLAGAVDLFVVYDNIKYTKKGWINRNRLLQNGGDAVFSLPLMHDSDALDIDRRELAASFDRECLLARFRGAYARAPQFGEVRPLLERIVRYGDNNLFAYLHHSLREVHAALALASEVRVASTIDADHLLRGQERVLALCEALGADTYINPPGGVDLYRREDFAARSIALKFLRPQPLLYPQFGGAFVPWLSIVDVLMFNPLEVVREWVGSAFDID